jgi:hypothetical protein
VRASTASTSSMRLTPTSIRGQRLSASTARDGAAVVEAVEEDAERGSGGSDHVCGGGKEEVPLCVVGELGKRNLHPRNIRFAEIREISS